MSRNCSRKPPLCFYESKAGHFVDRPFFTRTAVCINLNQAFWITISPGSSVGRIALSPVHPPGPHSMFTEVISESTRLLSATQITDFFLTLLAGRAHRAGASVLLCHEYNSDFADCCTSRPSINKQQKSKVLRDSVRGAEAAKVGCAPVLPVAADPCFGVRVCRYKMG